MNSKLLLSALVLAQAGMAVPVRAELVFEEENRQDTRGVMATADKAIVTQTIPESVEPDNLSRAEIMRRSRVRKEIQNEDILQARIEELRMKDEQKRTKQILADEPSDSAESMVSGAHADGNAPMMSNQVAAPQLKQMETVTVQASSAAPIVVAPVVAEQPVEKAEEEDVSQIYISPRVGYGSATNLNGLQNSPRFALGGAMGILFSENMAFELGYTYLEQGFSNPYAFVMIPGINQNEYFNYRQNIVDATLKLFFLGKQSKLKPFVGGGLAYSKGYLNYDQRVRSFMMNGLNGNGMNDYEVDAFLGHITLGADLALTKMVSVSAGFTYHGNFSARENFSSGTNPMAFYTQEAYEKQAVGSTVARSGFYTVGVGLNFLF